MIIFYKTSSTGQSVFDLSILWFFMKVALVLFHLYLPCFLLDLSFLWFFILIFLRNKKETLPEAQRTQGIESITWVNLSTRIVWNWFQSNFLNWLQIWPPDGATCICCQFCHRMHHLHIDSKFDHQMAPIALLANLPTRWHHKEPGLF